MCAGCVVEGLISVIPKRATLRMSVVALCHGGTSKSVRMLREMAIEEVG